MIKATCKICGFEKEFEVKYAGKSFKCPSCTSPVKIEINEIVAEPKKVNVDITIRYEYADIARYQIDLCGPIGLYFEEKE